MSTRANTKQDAGSSKESILPTNNEVVGSTNTVRSSEPPFVVTSDRGGDVGCQVRQDFSVAYDSRSDHDAPTFERNNRLQV